MTRTHPHHPRFPRNNLFRHSISFLFLFFIVPYIPKRACYLPFGIYINFLDYLARATGYIYCFMQIRHRSTTEAHAFGTKSAISSLFRGKLRSCLVSARGPRVSALRELCVFWSRWGEKVYHTRRAASFITASLTV